MSADLYPLATLEQIENTPSRQDGIPAELEEDLRIYGCKLISEAGVLLNQKQVAVATAQILFQRFWFVTSMKQFGIGRPHFFLFPLLGHRNGCSLPGFETSRVSC